MRPQQVDPALNPAFSKRLHRWLKKHGTYERELHLFVLTNTDYATLYPKIMIGKLNVCDCHPNDFVGLSMRSILSGNRNLDYGCFPSFGEFLAPAPELEAEYLRIGRCAFDPSHEIPFIDERWETADSVRRCKWCGLFQNKIVESRTITVTNWVAVQ